MNHLNVLAAPTPRQLAALLALAGLACHGGAAAATALDFFSTSDVSHWQVATNVGGVDGQFSSFPTTGFVPATAVTGRTTDGVGWIANNASGSNGGNWTFFVFTQTVDLTGYDPATADLQFKWAADDSGQVFASRGSWVPKYSVNGNALVTGTWAGGDTYVFGDVNQATAGFVSGLNTISFYVEGNGVTDGFALSPISFTATPVPELPGSASLLMGAGVLCWLTRRRRVS